MVRDTSNGHIPQTGDREVPSTPHPKWSHQRAETVLKADEMRSCPLPAPGTWYPAFPAFQPPLPIEGKEGWEAGELSGQFCGPLTVMGFSPLSGEGQGAPPRMQVGSPEVSEEEGPTVAPQLATLSTAAAPRSTSPGPKLPCSGWEVPEGWQLAEQCASRGPWSGGLGKRSMGRPTGFLQPGRTEGRTAGRTEGGKERWGGGAGPGGWPGRE